jgi:peptide/nickel transport system permease protein
MKKYILKRLFQMIFIVVGISLITFFIMHLIPGDPARVIAGPAGTAESIGRVRELMGLNKPLHIQLIDYYSKLIRFDFGESWFSGNPILYDISNRLPATIELLLIGFLIAVLIFVPLGVVIGFNPKGIANKILNLYSLIAGAIPDFWLGLMMVLLFYVFFQIVPPPLGRIAIGLEPTKVTGLYILDSILTANIKSLLSAINYIILPASCLAFVMGGPIIKMTISSIRETNNKDFMEYAKMLGLNKKMLRKYSLKNSALPIITLIGVLFNYMISGAIMIEMVFSWGGLGQYAVSAIINKDYNTIIAIVIFMSVVASLIYLFVDLIYFYLDPRIRSQIE